jgi:hypothetical protein
MAPIKVNNNGVKREPTKLVGDSITKKKLVGDLIEINMLATSKLVTHQHAPGCYLPQVNRDGSLIHQNGVGLSNSWTIGSCEAGTIGLDQKKYFAHLILNFFPFFIILDYRCKRIL